MIGKLTTTEATPGTEGLAGRYLSLSLGNESCAVPIHKIREIIRLPGFLSGSTVSQPLKGVIELHGRRIPVLDLRASFGRVPSGSPDRTCVVVIQISTPATSSSFVGLVVDGVQEVIEIEASQIASLAHVGSQVESAFMLGMAKVHGMMKILLDIDRVVDAFGLRPRQ